MTCYLVNAESPSSYRHTHTHLVGKHQPITMHSIITIALPVLLLSVPVLLVETSVLLVHNTEQVLPDPPTDSVIELHINTLSGHRHQLCKTCLTSCSIYKS